MSSGTRYNCLMALSTISRILVNVILEVSNFEIVSSKNPKLAEISIKLFCKFF
jgi:hypothetical protein